MSFYLLGGLCVCDVCTIYIFAMLERYGKYFFMVSSSLCYFVHVPVSIIILTRLYVYVNTFIINFYTFTCVCFCVRFLNRNRTQGGWCLWVSHRAAQDRRQFSRAVVLLVWLVICSRSLSLLSVSPVGAGCRVAVLILWLVSCSVWAVCDDLRAVEGVAPAREERRHVPPEGERAWTRAAEGVA